MDQVLAVAAELVLRSSPGPPVVLVLRGCAGDQALATAEFLLL
jgi:hypothetical protein